MGMLAPLSDTCGSPALDDSLSARPSKEVVSVLYVDENTKSWIQVPESQGTEKGDVDFDDKELNDRCSCLCDMRQFSV